MEDKTAELESLLTDLMDMPEWKEAMGELKKTSSDKVKQINDHMNTLIKLVCEDDTDDDEDTEDDIPEEAYSDKPKLKGTIATYIMARLNSKHDDSKKYER